MFFSQLNISENGVISKIELSGNYDKSKMTGNLILSTIDGKHFEVPFVKYKYELTTSFDKVSINFAADNKESDNMHIKGNITAIDLLCNHWRISPSDVKFSSLSLNFDSRIYKNEII